MSGERRNNDLQGKIRENKPVSRILSQPHRRGNPLVARWLVGKGEVKATPSPLPRGGQSPLFTDVPVSGIGRLRPQSTSFEELSILTYAD